MKLLTSISKFHYFELQKFISLSCKWQLKGVDFHYLIQNVSGDLFFVSISSNDQMDKMTIRSRQTMLSSFWGKILETLELWLRICWIGPFFQFLSFLGKNSNKMYYKSEILKIFLKSSLKLVGSYNHLVQIWANFNRHCSPDMFSVKFRNCHFFIIIHENMT